MFVTEKKVKLENRSSLKRKGHRQTRCQEVRIMDSFSLGSWENDDY